MNQPPSKITYIVVISIALLAVLGVGTICMSLFMHTYADAAILTAIITLTSNLTGALVALLVRPGQSSPAPVTVENKPSDPIPVTSKPEEKPKTESTT